MRISVHHTTIYHYDDAPHRSTQILRLFPQNHDRQRVVEWSLELPDAAPQFIDAYGNISHLLCLEKPPQEITIVAKGTVDVDESAESPSKESMSPLVFLQVTPLTRADDAILEFTAPFQKLIKVRTFLGLNDLSSAILEKVPYQSGTTTVQHTAAQSFAEARGVCQDHAHVFLACARALGIPARYVSGYVHSPEQTQVASHAWSEAWIGNRWASFDISNAIGTDSGEHIQLAVGLDYLDACPVRGVRLGGDNEVLESHAEVKIGH